MFVLTKRRAERARMLLTVRHILRLAIYVTVVWKVNRADVLYRETNNINMELVVLREDMVISNVVEQSLLSFLSLHFNITRTVRITNIA
jgi:hypothetical protein